MAGSKLLERFYLMLMTIGEMQLAHRMIEFLYMRLRKTPGRGVFDARDDGEEDEPEQLMFLLDVTAP